MKGQTERDIRAARLQQKLRNGATDAERKLWHHLRARQMAGCKFRRQHPFQRFIIDFVCLERKLVIELDGGQHVEAAARDCVRDAFLAAAGFTTLRFWNDDVLLRTADVLEVIFQALRLTDPHPCPRHEGEHRQLTHPHPGPPLEGEGASPLREH